MSRSGDDRSGLAGRLRIQGETASPIVPAGTSRFTLAGELILVVQGFRSEATSSLAKRKSVPSSHIRCGITVSFLATAIWALAMPRRSATASPPGKQRRPFPAAHRARVRRFDQVGAETLVTVPRRDLRADLGRDSRLAGLVTARPQAEMRADVGRSLEPLGPIDGGAMGECPCGAVGTLQPHGDRADAGRDHPLPASRLDLDDVEHPLGQPGEVLDHRRQHGRERRESAGPIGPSARARRRPSPASGRQSPGASPCRAPPPPLG